MSQDGESTRDDLELTSDEADRVKGGVFPVEPYGDDAVTGRIVTGHKKKKKHKKHQTQIGPYKGKH